MKIRNDADIQKIIRHCGIYGGFKVYSDIERSSRLIRKIQILRNAKILIHDGTKFLLNPDLSSELKDCIEFWNTFPTKEKCEFKEATKNMKKIPNTVLNFFKDEFFK